MSSTRLPFALFLALSIVALDGCKKKGADGADAAADAAAAADAGPAEDETAADASADTGAPALTPTQNAAPPSPFAEGQSWSGSYTCITPGTVTLLVHAGGTHVNLVFSFKKDGQAGQFKMSGTYTPGTRHLHLTAGEWISRPGNYTTVDLDGKVSADGKTFSGTATGPGCSTFSVHR